MTVHPGETITQRGALPVSHFEGYAMSILGLLVLLIVFCVVVWAARALLAAFAVPEPISTVVWVLIVLIAVFTIVSQFGLLGSGTGLGLHRSLL